MSDRNLGRLLLVLAAILWGLAGVCVKSITWSTLSIMCSRCLIGVFLFGFIRKSFKPVFDKETIIAAIFMMFTGITYMAAIKLTTAASAIVLQYIAPILVFIYTVIFQGRKIKLLEIFVIFIVFSGCVLSFAGDLDPTKTLGNLLAILSGFVFAGQLITFANPKVNSYDGMFMANLMSFILCLPFMIFDKQLSFDTKNIIWILILGIFQYGMANICYSSGCQKVDKVEGSLILMIEPVFNPIPVYFITKEGMTPLSFVGFFMVIIGVILNILTSNTNKNNS